MVVPVGMDSECTFNFPENRERDIANRNCSLVNRCNIALQKQLSSAEERLLQSRNLSLHASSYALIKLALHTAMFTSTGTSSGRGLNYGTAVRQV